MNYYRRFVGDYLKDTQHLTTLEHGIYTLLLDHLYSTEKPIANLSDAYRICRCQNSASRRHCKLIVSRFFYTDDLGIWHKRVEEEISYAESKRKKAKASAEARWKSDADAMRSHSVGNATSDSRLQTPEKEESKSKQGLSGFELFFNAYPENNRVSHSAARIQWLRQVKADDNWPQVLEGLEKWKLSKRWADGFIPDAKNFLKDRLWESEVPNGKQQLNKAEQRDRANVEAAAEALRRRAGRIGLDGAIRKELPH